MNTPAGDFTVFHVCFADGQFLLLARSAGGLVDSIRCFAEANVPEFSFAPVDETSFEEMCRRSNAQVFVSRQRPTKKELKQLAVLSRARNAMRVVAWDASGAPQTEVATSDVVQLPIADENSIPLLF